MSRVTLADGWAKFMEATRGQHNDLGAKEFEELLLMLDQVTPEGFRVTRESIARRAGVHRHAVDPWIAQYNKEHAEDHDRSPV